MTPLVIPGGWYCDSRPDGTYAAALWHGREVLTNFGAVPYPPDDDPLWIVVNRTGTRLAAQSHNFPTGWEWTGMAWEPRPAPCGVWPVIYDAQDVLHISACEPGVGSQGWRYVAPDGRLVTGDETVAVRQGLNEWTDLSLAQDGSCLVGQDNGGAGVAVWAAGKRRLLTPGACYNVRAKWDGLVSVSCYNVAPDGVEARFFWLTMAELCALPVIEPPPVEQPIGPVSSPRPADGKFYDLVPFVVGADSTWPRKGPTHTLGQIFRGGLFYFVKFAGNEPGAAQGQCHEAWAFDANWIYQLYDRSSGPAIQMSDPRMWPRRMPIGEASRFETGPHELIRREPPDCREVAPREPIQRRMWLHALWDQFYCGPDLGTRRAGLLVYDNTAGIHNAGRYLEVTYYAEGAGAIRWEAHRSDLVYANGKTAVFTDDSRKARSDFYLKGGPNPDPQVVACIPQTVPSYPPWDPHPPVPPVERYQRIKAY